MKVPITGGCGFIGSNTAARFSVIGALRYEPAHLPDGVDFLPVTAAKVG